MNSRLQEIVQERDFYKAERNRLRDLLGREPNMKHLVQGPLSPQATRQPVAMGGNQMEPQMGRPPPPPAGFQDTAPSPRRGREGPERPIRRSTQTQGDFNTLPYPHQAPSSIPPVQAGFTTGPVQSLPPLRAANTIDQPHSTTVPSQSSSSTAPPPPPPSLGGSYPGWHAGRSYPGDNIGRRP